MLAVCEYTTRSDDRQLIEQANQEGRILLTEDNDFGWLVFVSQAQSAGVILIRYPGNLRAQLARSVVELVREHGSALTDTFAVLQPGHVRLSRRPDHPAPSAADPNTPE